MDVYYTTGSAIMRFLKEPFHGCLVYYRKYYNEILKGAIPRMSSILQEVL